MIFDGWMRHLFLRQAERDPAIPAILPPGGFLLNVAPFRTKLAMRKAAEVVRQEDPTGDENQENCRRALGPSVPLTPRGEKSLKKMKILFRKSDDTTQGLVEEKIFLNILLETYMLDLVN